MLDVTTHQDRVQIGPPLLRHLRAHAAHPGRRARVPAAAVARALPGAARGRLRRPRARRLARARRRVPADVPARGDVAELPRRALAAERAQGRRRQGQRAVGRALPPAPHDAPRRTTSSRRRSRGWTASTRATGFIRQFVAMPLGSGLTIEGQVTGEETHGGLQLVCFDPKPGRFPEQPPSVARDRVRRRCPPARPAAGGAAEMGLAAGGRMRQQLYPDPHGIDTWDQDNYGRVFVHIVNSRALDADHGRAAAADAGRRAQLHQRRPAVVRPLRRPPRRHRAVRHARQGQGRGRAAGGGRGVVRR